MAAASAGHTAIVKLLLERGANIDAVDQVRLSVRQAVEYIPFLLFVVRISTAGFEFLIHGV